ncbi:hypothetical protein BCR44DRAFT_1463496 [Catenaria anguillulae PL171]|uniref:Uncharacterized protein n=1 Tax=Catenaria anguillulae PL171 TaxID=765915 RepID=A0A1Y2HFV0_9FUNG|nr:hypothetical protein BCR44DRAFT_1463496 [Catenaria anguillulae PL171]
MDADATKWQAGATVATFIASLDQVDRAKVQGRACSSIGDVVAAVRRFAKFPSPRLCADSVRKGTTDVEMVDVSDEDEDPVDNMRDGPRMAGDGPLVSGHATVVDGDDLEITTSDHIDIINIKQVSGTASICTATIHTATSPSSASIALASPTTQLILLSSPPPNSLPQVLPLFNLSRNRLHSQPPFHQTIHNTSRTRHRFVPIVWPDEKSSNPVAKSKFKSGNVTSHVVAGGKAPATGPAIIVPSSSTPKLPNLLTSNPPVIPVPPARVSAACSSAIPPAAQRSLAEIPNPATRTQVVGKLMPHNLAIPEPTPASIGSDSESFIDESDHEPVQGDVGTRAILPKIAFVDEEPVPASVPSSRLGIQFLDEKQVEPVGGAQDASKLKTHGILHAPLATRERGVKLICRVRVHFHCISHPDPATASPAHSLRHWRLRILTNRALATHFSAGIWNFTRDPRPEEIIDHVSPNDKWSTVVHRAMHAARIDRDGPPAQVWVLDRVNKAHGMAAYERHALSVVDGKYHPFARDRDVPLRIWARSRDTKPAADVVLYIEQMPNTSAGNAWVRTQFSDTSVAKFVPVFIKVYDPPLYRRRSRSGFDEQWDMCVSDFRTVGMTAMNRNMPVSSLFAAIRVLSGEREVGKEKYWLWIEAAVAKDGDGIGLGNRIREDRVWRECTVPWGGVILARQVDG